MIVPPRPELVPASEKAHRVAIIIPVYNISRYLKECLDSALSQTYKAITIFAVNDGSTDNSGEILNEYVGNHARLHVINKQNGGVSSARNAGLDAIEKSGEHYEFVYFLDGDDTLPSNFVQVLVNALENENADIAICPVSEFDKLGMKMKPHPIGKPSVLDRDAFVECYYGLNGWEETSVAYRFLVNKFFRLSTFKDFRFDETFKTAEDQEYVILSVMPTLSKAVIVLDTYSQYRLRNSSLSREVRVNQVNEIYFKAILLKDKYSKLARREIEKRYVGGVYRELKDSFATGNYQRQLMMLQELKRMSSKKWEFPQTFRQRIRILLAYLPMPLLKVYCLSRAKAINTTTANRCERYFD